MVTVIFQPGFLTVSVVLGYVYLCPGVAKTTVMDVFVYKTTSVFAMISSGWVDWDRGEEGGKNRILESGGTGVVGLAMAMAAGGPTFLSVCSLSSTHRGPSTSPRFCRVPSSSSATSTLTTWGT